MAKHLARHGDGVKTIALWVEDALSAFEKTVSRGAKPYLEPEEIFDEIGVLRHRNPKLLPYSSPIY